MSDVDIDLLVVECMDRVEREGEGAVEEMCRAHPSAAAELRSAMQALVGVGFATPAREASTHGFQPGDVIGVDYEIVRQVGRGGMGVVFEARDRRLGRRVALKVVHVILGESQDAAARFEREAAIAASLDHPGLIRVYAGGIHDGDGVPWLAMEFVEGRTLADRIAALEDEAASLRLRAAWIRDCASALAAMHDRGLVHRDVKPSNIMLREDGSVALGDFGLARHQDDLGLTQSGSFAGTPHYASPEQANGESITPASDVFSLGITLYEVLTGRRPFDGPTQQRVFHAIERTEPVAPDRHDPRIPRDLVAITMRALEKDPRARYDDGADLAHDLEAFLDGRPVRARNIGAFARAWRWCRREPLKAALVAILVLSVAAISGLLGYSISQRPLVAEAKEQRRFERARDIAMRGWIDLLISNDGGAKASFEESLEILPREDTALGASFSVRNLRGLEAEIAHLRSWISRLGDARALRRRLAFVLSGADVIDRPADLRREAAVIREELGPSRETLEFMLEAVHILHDFEVGSREGGERERFLRTMERAALASHGPEPLVYAQLASFWADQGIQEAEQQRSFLSDVILRLWPESAFAHALAGRLLERDDPDRAERHYERAIRIDPSLVALEWRLASIDVVTDRFDEAERRCRLVLAKLPKQRDAMRVLAAAHEFRGDVDGAIEMLDAAIRAAGQTGLAVAQMCEHLVVVCRRRNRASVALELLEEHCERVEDLPAIHVLYAELAESLGRRDDAKRMLDRYLSKRDSPSVRNYRAMLAWQRKDYDAALVDLEAASELEPVSRRLSINLAKLRLARGETDKAHKIAKSLVEDSGYRDARALAVLVECEVARDRPASAFYYARMGFDLLRSDDEADPQLLDDLRRWCRKLRPPKK